MISLPNWKTSKSPELNLYNLLYIGTKGIDYALCEIFEGKFKILDSESTSFNEIIVSDMPTVKMPEIKEAVDKLLTKSKERTGKSTKKTLIGIPSLYTLNQTITLRIKRDRPAEKIDKKELEEINVRILANSKLEAEKKLSPGQNSELEVVNSDFSFIKLDGYLTKDIEGMRGSILEISQFSSFSTKQYLNNLVDLTKSLKLDLITVTSSTYSLVRYIKDNYKLENYMLINFGGHTTDVGVVFGDELINTSSIRLGTESLLSYISTKTENSKEKVLEILQQKGEESEEKVLQKDFENFWLESLIKSLDSLEGIKIYPSLIMVYGDEQLFIDKYKLAAQFEKLKFKDSPQVISLNEKVEISNDLPINLQSLGNFIQNLE